MDKLKHSGLKNTKSRRIILDILDQSNQPISAERISLELEKMKVSINLSTVYRTLETLSDKNLITKLSILDENRTLFEYNRKVHRHYLVCIKCKKILTIMACPIESYEKALEDETGFKIVGHKLYLYGYCPECQSKK